MRSPPATTLRITAQTTHHSSSRMEDPEAAAVDRQAAMEMADHREIIQAPRQTRR